MSKIIFIFCFFNLYSALAFRRQSIELPENDDKSTRDVNLKGSRDGKRKFILIQDEGYGLLFLNDETF